MHMPRHIRIPFWAATAVALVLMSVQSTAATMSVEGIVPQAASALGRQIDRQVALRLAQPETPAMGVSLAVTVPVDVNDLDDANPLARQMAEELARWFVQAGYQVQEIRKGRSVLFEPDTGELLLTRRRDLLSSTTVTSNAILAGTYTVTNQNVRFNIRIIETASRNVLGMATISVPVTAEVKSLINNSAGTAKSLMGFGPTVSTMLP